MQPSCTAAQRCCGPDSLPICHIDANNVARLGLAWQFKTGTFRGLEATPIVVDGVMFTSGDWGIVYALDAATGRKLWGFDPANDGQAARYACCDVVNRGVAVWRGAVYVGSTDGRLFALDARTGAKRWSVDTIANHSQPYSLTGAPQIAGAAVVIGNAGADIGKGGVRGYVSAYDVRTGHFLWRFYTVPSRDDAMQTTAMRAALATWDTDSEPQGGTVWAGMSYDPNLDLLYIGTGNAAPYQRQGRNPHGAHGDDLYASAIIALNARTGELRWHFQTTPGDSWDQDADSPFVQADIEWAGRVRPVLMQAGKNGFFYVLDRRTGEFLSGKPFTFINWARALDARGRPIVTHNADYTAEPRLIYPSSAGAHAWSPMSYSRQTHLVYIGVIDAPMVWIDLEHRPLTYVDGSFGVGLIFPDKDYDPKDWAPWFGSLPAYAADAATPRRVIRGVLRAWDPVAGKVIWERETSRDYFVYDGGVLSTAGNLVFQGRASGAFVAYAADTGRALKSIETGTGIMAGPMSYEVGGIQYVAVMAGYGGGAIGLPLPPNSAGSRYVNEGRILAFRLDGAAVTLPPMRAAPVFSAPAVAAASTADIERGSALYTSYCSRCHVFGVGVLPDLRALPLDMHALFDEIVLYGRFRELGMGRFDDVLSQADVAAIHAYLNKEARSALQREQQGK